MVVPVRIKLVVKVSLGACIHSCAHGSSQVYRRNAGSLQQCNELVIAAVVRHFIALRHVVRVYGVLVGSNNKVKLFAVCLCPVVSFFEHTHGAIINLIVEKALTGKITDRVLVEHISVIAHQNAVAGKPGLYVTLQHLGRVILRLRIRGNGPALHRHIRICV